MPDQMILGIDLGTTNCSLSYSLNNGEGVEVIKIPQLLKPGLIEEKDQMPSALYIPVQSEFSVAESGLPWTQPLDSVIGVYAKDRASDVPDRVVLSAKSWLCQSAIDRKQAILPWESSILEAKVSPFDASVSYLKYLKNTAYNFKSLKNLPEISDIVLTVPASFDEIARNLTLEAASDAGLKSVSLLEEPMAALYSWVSRMGDSWRKQVSVGDVVLVCDIGGGTADFSLIYVGETNGELSLERLSVGQHLLLGGDNMDLALAYSFKQKLEESKKTVDNWQFQSLIQQARKVKERMLTEDIAQLPVTIAGKGSSLFANTLKIEIKREEIISQILEGFFPILELNEEEVFQESQGLSEFGLPYESEPALTKHLIKFLKNSNKQIAFKETIPEDLREKAKQGLLTPNIVLFNGGVCTPAIIRERITDVLKLWGGKEIKELEGTSLNTAVSEGAAYFGKVKATGSGIRIKAGIPRSYYLGLKTSMPAVPGFKAQIKGLCVVPQGMEEGARTLLSEQIFSLLIGQEVSFRLFVSRERVSDKFGYIVENAEGELEESASLTAFLPLNNTNNNINNVPVRIFSSVNDLGLLELWMQSTESDDRWKLEFNVRSEKKSLKFL